MKRAKGKGLGAKGDEILKRTNGKDQPNLAKGNSGLKSVNREKLDPEMRLLLSALQVDGRNKEEKYRIDPGAVNLSRAFRLARRHGVFPLFYKHLRTKESNYKTNREIESQKNTYLGNVGRNMQITQRLLHILKLLSDNGILAIPFKGPVIAVQAYDDIGLRSFCDLDILIQPRDFSSAYDLMESKGYQSLKPMVGRMKAVWRKTRRDFEFQGKGALIDFHQQVTTGPKFLQLRVKWDNLSSVELNSQKVPSLNLEDTILMLAMHGTHHGWNLLKYVADLSHLVDSHRDDINWELLTKKARRMGVLRMVLIGMCQGRDFCGLDIHPEINDLMFRDRPVGKLAAYFRDKILEPDKSNLIPQTAFPRCLDSWWVKLRFLAYYLFSPTNLDVLAVRLPMILYPPYFVIRPVRLLVNLARGRELS